MNKPTRACRLAASLCAVVLATGCNKPAAAPPEPPPLAKAPGAAPTAAPVTSTAPATPAPAAPVVIAEPTASQKAAAFAEYVSDMEQTLNDFLAEHIRKTKRTPKDIGEMMSLGLITSIPTPPPGKKWVIDQRTGKISAK